MSLLSPPLALAPSHSSTSLALSSSLARSLAAAGGGAYEWVGPHPLLTLPDMGVESWRGYVAVCLIFYLHALAHACVRACMRLQVKVEDCEEQIKLLTDSFEKAPARTQAYITPQAALGLCLQLGQRATPSHARTHAHQPTTRKSAPTTTLISSLAALAGGDCSLDFQKTAVTAVHCLECPSSALPWKACCGSQDNLLGC
jgi:hypothetical protein